MSKELRNADYLEHIRDAIAKIGRYTTGKDEAEFIGNELIQSRRRLIGHHNVMQ